MNKDSRDRLKTAQGWSNTIATIAEHDQSTLKMLDRNRSYSNPKNVQKMNDGGEYFKSLVRDGKDISNVNLDDRDEYFIIGFNHEKRLYKAQIASKAYNLGKSCALDGNTSAPKEYENDSDFLHGFNAGIYELGKNHGLSGGKNIPEEYSGNSVYLKGVRDGIEQSIMNIVFESTSNSHKNR